MRIAQGLGVDTLLRVESRDVDLLCKYADMGPSSLMVPMINSGEETERVVRALCYPPRGERSFASRRLVDLVGLDHHQQPQPIIVIQIETPQALDCIDQIVAVDGTDVVFFSPDDFRLQTGIPYDTAVLDHPDLIQAMRAVAEAARRVGKWAGIPVPTPETASAAADMGYQLIVGGSDAGFVYSGARQRLKQLTEVLGRSNRITPRDT